VLEKIGLSRSTYVEYVERQAQKQAQRREEKASPSHLNRSWRRFQLALYLMKLVDFEMTATEVSRGVKETDGGEGEKDAYRLCCVPCAVCRAPCAVYYCSPIAVSSLRLPIPHSSLFSGKDRTHALESLQSTASANAGMIAVLCDSLNWHVLSSIFRSAAARIASGVPSELLPLMQAS
jgi:hypothetical protein